MNNLIADSITITLGLLGLIAPAAIGYIMKGSKMTKEIGELFLAIALAIEDKKVTGTELS